MNIRPHIYVLMILWIGMSLSACAGFLGETGLPPVEADREHGQEVVKQVTAQIGIVKQARITDYLNAVGRRLGHAHYDQRFEYVFQVLDQPQANAFAVPGGHVFVSRGLLALANNEDELANVMGHEIIHVSRRHSAKQMAKQKVPNLLTLPGRMVGSVVGEGIGNMINAPISTLGAAYLAKHSREDEFEADRLGQELTAQAGYDPQTLATFLVRLQKVSQLRMGEQRGPGFFDTHPTTPDRVDRLTGDAQKIKWTRQPGVVSDPAAFLYQMDGLMLGENPAMGVLQGHKFLQPALDFSIAFPSDWKAVNTFEAVVAFTPKKDAVLLLSIFGKGKDLDQAAEQLIQAMQKAYRVKPTRSEPFRMGNFPAHHVFYTDTSGKEPMHLYFLWISYRERLYQLISLAPDRYQGVLHETALSFRPLNAEERASIMETRLRIVSAQENETVGQLSERTGNVWDLETTLVMNGFTAGQLLKDGQLLKIAVTQPYKFTGQ